MPAVCGMEYLANRIFLYSIVLVCDVEQIRTCIYIVSKGLIVGGGGRMECKYKEMYVWKID